MHLICLIRSFQQPIRNIHDFYTFVLIHFLPCAGNDHLRICVRDFQQRRHLALEGIGIVYGIGNLNIQLLAALDRYKVDLFFIQDSGVQLIAAP